MESHWIYSMYVDELKGRVDKANKKAAKLKVPPIVLVVTDDTKVKERIITMPDGSERKIRETFRRIEITMEPVKINGWAPVAVLDFAHSEPVIREMPDRKIPKHLIGTDNFCDHCKVRKNRYTTYILEKDGEHIRVGSTCLKDYLGHSPTHMVNQAKGWRSIWELFMPEDDDDHWGPRYKGDHWNLEVFLLMVSACIRSKGWVSRSKAYEDPSLCATADLAVECFAPGGHGAAVLRYIVTAGEDEDMVKSAVDRALTLTDDQALQSAYLNNLRVIARDGFARHKELGYAASIISWHQRETEKEAEEARRAAGSQSDYIGEIKERIIATATLKTLKYLDSDWGVTALHIFETGEGNILTWFASGIPADEMEEGEEYKIKATVKKHSLYRGEKRTVITRVKTA